jgi:hypothetical protein
VRCGEGPINCPFLQAHCPTNKRALFLSSPQPMNTPSTKRVPQRRVPMKIISSVLLASAMALFAATASAQEESTVQDRHVYIFTNGKMVHMPVNETNHAMIMKNFKPMKTGTMIYYSGGRYYAAEDAPMENGKMMSSELFGKTFGFSQ